MISRDPENLLLQADESFSTFTVKQWYVHVEDTQEAICKVFHTSSFSVGSP
jgi:hypothetical protein